MEENKIIEGNKLIAEFMGGKHNGGSYYRFYYGIDIVGVKENCRPVSWIETNLKYHTSWDWLMPCVKKFDYLAENKVIPFSDDFEFWCDKIEDTITRTYEIEPVFKIMVEAITWYNTTTKNKTS